MAVTSEEVTALADGGSGPFTYSWAAVLTDGGGWSAESPNAQTSRFTATNVGAGDSRDANFACTITDQNGATAVTPEVAVSVTNFGGL